MPILSKATSGIQGYITDLWGNDVWQKTLDNRWAITAGLLGTYWLYKIFKWPRNLPPGPRGLPIIGALTNISEDFHKDLIGFSKEYNSDIVSLYIGRQLTVSLNSADAIREAFLKSEDFSDRGRFAELFDLQDQLITQSPYNERWKKLKSFVISSLRTHGLGTQKSEEQIKLQLDRVIDILEMKKGAPMSKPQQKELFMKATTSVLLKMIANQSYDFGDPELVDLIERIIEYQRIFFGEGFTIIVWLDIVPMWLLRFFVRGTLKRCVSSAAGIRNILLQHLEDHRATLDERNPRDYLDDSIIQFTNDPSFTDRMIIDTTIVFLSDATETISSQLLWCLVYLCVYPQYQEKMVKEISSVCGANRPSLKDRGKLLMCEAVILEGMRRSSMAAISGGHTCSKDVPFRGYIIPKGSTLQGNLYAVHNDPKLFPEPEKFKPERFIGDGKLINTENVMPFGLGRRKCPGEPLTKSEIFLFLTGIVQRFDINFAEGHRPASLEVKGVFRKTPDCKMTFTPR